MALKGTLEINITQIDIIEGGVQIFVNATLNGSPVGFGKDGTVETERFRIYNPPVLVDDPSGIILKESLDEETGEVTIRTLTEDPNQAIQEVLAYNIALVGKSGENIIAGTVGNTVSTFYPNASSIDGFTQRERSGAEEAWATIRAGAGTNASDTDAITQIIKFLYIASTGWRDFRRSITGFDTSALGSDTIDSAIWSIYGSAKGSLNGISPDITLVSASLVSDTSLTASDFDLANYGTTTLGTIPYASISTSGYNDLTLTTAGEAHINGSGITNFGIRDKSHDIDNVTPTATTTGSAFITAYFVDETGTTKDPKLVVTHTASGTHTSMTAVVGAFTLTGVAVALALAWIMTAVTTAFTLTGNAVTFLMGKGISALTGAFTLTGNNVAFATARSMIASVGSFTLTGIAVTLTYTQATVGIIAETGAFILTGANALLKPSNIWKNNVSKNDVTFTNQDKSS